jgi:hypothetical protein
LITPSDTALTRTPREAYSIASERVAATSPPLGDVEEPGEVHGDDRRVVLDGVFRERLADVDAGVVDQRVDASEALERLVDSSAGCFSVGDVACDRDVIALLAVGGRERQRDADDGISGASITGD